MKHLKLYEDIEKYKKFWLISTEPKKYELTLKMLKVPTYEDCYNNDHTYTDKIYFGIFNDGKRIKYDWNYASRNGYTNFIDFNYEYCGEIEIPEYLISGDKYNL